MREEIERVLGPRRPSPKRPSPKRRSPREKEKGKGKGKGKGDDKGKGKGKVTADIRRYVSPEKPRQVQDDASEQRPAKSARRALDVGPGGAEDASEPRAGSTQRVFASLECPGSLEGVRPALLAYMTSLGEAPRSSSGRGSGSGVVADVHAEVLAQVLLDMAAARDLVGCRMALGMMRRCAARLPAWARPVARAADALNRAVSELVGQPVVLV